MVVCPGFVIVITPPQIQTRMEALLSAGKLAIKTVGHPGIHGDVVFGTHGAGVKFTGGGLFVAGLAGLLHIPNEAIFTNGL